MIQYHHPPTSVGDQNTHVHLNYGNFYLQDITKRSMIHDSGTLTMTDTTEGLPTSARSPWFHSTTHFFMSRSRPLIRSYNPRLNPAVECNSMSYPFLVQTLQSGTNTHVHVHCSILQSKVARTAFTCMYPSYSAASCYKLIT